MLAQSQLLHVELEVRLPPVVISSKERQLQAPQLRREVIAPLDLLVACGVSTPTTAPVSKCKSCYQFINKGLLIKGFNFSGPVPVLVMSLLFIASVFMLHIWGKFTKA